MGSGVHPRGIRSFVRREGRMTNGQRRALELLWPNYGVAASSGTLDLNILFGRQAPRVVEIGFGMGDALAELAAHYPGRDYLGIEVYRTGVGSLLMKIKALGLENVRIICTDAMQALSQQIPLASIDAVHLFFPDPWPKKRHHKRRLVQPAFVELVRQSLKIGGRLCMATDWQAYAGHMLQVMRKAPQFTNTADPGAGFAHRPRERPVTKFERRAEEQGREIWDLVFVRSA